jgi:outer membrane autotransporter protein
MFTLSLASKTELEVAFARFFSLRPGILLVYNMINSGDYTTSLRANIRSKKLSNFQIMPGAKLVVNINDGFKPYLSASYALNENSSSEITANGIVLQDAMPEFKVKKYAQYGVGFESDSRNNFAGFAQVSAFSGSLKGWTAQAGIRAYFDGF